MSLLSDTKNRPQRRGSQSFIGSLTGRFGRGHRLAASATAQDDWDDEVPQVRVSRAFVVMLLLHLVAIGGLFAFHMWGEDKENPPAPAASAAAAPAPVTTVPLAAAETPLPGTEAPRAIPMPTDAEAPAAAPAVPSPNSHRLLKGETRELLAARFGITSEKLTAANPQATWAPGTTIRIPEPASEPDAVVSAATDADASAKLQRTAPMAATPVTTAPERNPSLQPITDASADPLEPESGALAVGERQPDTYVQEKSTPAPKPVSKPRTEAKSQPVRAEPAPRETAAATKPAVSKSSVRPIAKPATKAPSAKPSAEVVVKTKPKTTPEPARSAGSRTHVVVKGDTIYNIARRYGFSANEIMRLNSLADPDRLRVGDRLRVPVRR
jgi:LysM repeat protein